MPLGKLVAGGMPVSVVQSSVVKKRVGACYQYPRTTMGQ